MPSSAPAVSVEIKKKVEVLLFVHDNPLSTRDLVRSLGGDVDRLRWSWPSISAAGDGSGDKPYEVVAVGGWMAIAHRPEYAP